MAGHDYCRGTMLSYVFHNQRAFTDWLGRKATWQSHRNIRPVSTIIRPPLFITPPPTIITRRPTIMISASTKRRKSMPRPLTNTAEPGTNTRRPPTNILTSRADSGGDDSCLPGSPQRPVGNVAQPFQYSWEAAAGQRMGFGPLATPAGERRRRWKLATLRGSERTPERWMRAAAGGGSSG